MQPWTSGLLGAFDLETTSADPFEARIVTAAVLLVGPRFGAVARQWLVDPGVEIPAEATAIHGITTEQARAEGRPTDEAVFEIANLLRELWASGLPIVAMNAAFDLSVLNCEIARHHGDEYALTPGLVLDPLVIDRAMDRYRRGKKTLADLCRVYGVDQADAHDAHGDALSAARVVWKMAERYESVGGSDLASLHARQADWHAAWAVDFEAWLKARKREDGASEEAVAAISIEREWPLRTPARRTA